MNKKQYQNKIKYVIHKKTDIIIPAKSFSTNQFQALGLSFLVNRTHILAKASKTLSFGTLKVLQRDKAHLNIPMFVNMLTSSFGAKIYIFFK